MPYQYIEHTSDIGIQAENSTLKNLLKDLLEGFLNIYFEKIETIEKSSQKQTLVFPADSLQNLIVDLMNECIFIIETSETIPVEILEVKKEEDTYSITILKKRR
ncbi:MAG: archease, partial [bacterium]|nr:archease [bacterium]